MLSGATLDISSVDFAGSLSSVFADLFCQGKEQAVAMKKRRITIVFARESFILRLCSTLPSFTPAHCMAHLKDVAIFYRHAVLPFFHE